MKKIIGSLIIILTIVIIIIVFNNENNDNYSSKITKNDTSQNLSNEKFKLPDMSKIKEIVNSAKQKSIPWSGPKKGPKAQKGKTIVFFAEDLKNGGILTVAKGVKEAIKVIGWDLKFVDAQGNDKNRKMAYKKALDYNPDGFILGGADAKSNLEYLKELDKEGIKIVGWHSGEKTGPIKNTPVLINITTENKSVAETAAYYALDQTEKEIGAVIFTDSRFQIAMDKANFMKEVIESSPNNKVLAFEDVSLAKANTLMEPTVTRLLNQFGNKWTHSFGINDLYFDYAGPVLAKNKIIASNAITNISAGDGSESAFQRIRENSFQSATVAEPLLLQGWQLVDELNRIFAGENLSGYVNHVHLVTQDNINSDSGKDNIYDPDNNYREIYTKIWK